jgi:peptidoglycan/LPS O-acetylase OafA/YrhL
MNKSSDLPNLDILRAGAVSMVLFDHTFQAFAFKSVRIAWLGRLGVLFFFVHTCCVLMMSLERQMQSSQKSIWVFYLRRFFRIYPLSIAAVAAAWLFHRHFLDVFGWLANFALIQNLTRSPDAFPGVWSLPIEVQMYIFLPLLFLLATRLTGIAPLVGLWVCFFILALVQSFFSHQLNLLTFAPCFIPGVIAWMLFSKQRPQLPAWGWPIFLITLIATFEVRPNWNLRSWFVCLALGLFMPLFAQSTNTLLNRGTFLLAKYSYGIYLGHSVLLLCIKPTCRILPLYIAAVFLFAWLGYICIEQPMMQFGRRLTSKRSQLVNRSNRSSGIAGNEQDGSYPKAAEGPIQHRLLPAVAVLTTKD